MKDKALLENLERDIDAFAAIEHERWSHWQEYLHSKCAKQPDGSLVIPAELACRWDAQMKKTFDKLSFEEQESDREQVRKYFPLLKSLANQSN